MKRNCDMCAVPEEYLFDSKLVLHDDRILCEDCVKFVSSDEYFKKFSNNSRDFFYKELLDYIKKKNKILYAYSGGKDSTAALYLLKTLLDEKFKGNKELRVFTLYYSFKGEKTTKNIENVIKYLDIEDTFELIDISRKIVPFYQKEVDELYLEKYMSGSLPCGKFCNNILHYFFIREMRKYGTSELLTGGDTPVLNENGEYSIFWNRCHGLIMVRTAYAFGLDKISSEMIIKENNIPWKDPRYGGYDTDCMLPGAIIYERFNGRKNVNIAEIVEKIPMLIEYLRKRVRFGVIKYEDAIKMLHELDIPDRNTVREFYRIVGNLKERYKLS